MNRPARHVVVGLALAMAASCASVPRFAIPAGPGVPAPDAVTIWQAARASCQTVRTFSSELRVSGRIGAERRSATVHVGLTDAGQIRLEVPAPFGRPVFTLAGNEGRATLVTRDNHTLTAPARDIVDALTGLSLDPRALLAVLSGCGAFSDVTAAGTRYEDIVAVTTGDRQRLYFRAAGEGWQVAAAELPGLIIDYAVRKSGPWPARLRASSSGDQGVPIDLTITQSQVVANESFPDGAFTLTPPANAIPLTLDELRRARQ
jgi:outer membrane biogenesis lipoprotein LolB